MKVQAHKTPLWLVPTVSCTKWHWTHLLSHNVLTRYQYEDERDSF